MSLITQCFSFLAIKPKVWVEQDKLYARASLPLRIASFGAYDRCVVADKQQRVISIYAKAFWMWRQPEACIPFDRVCEIDRSFNRWSTWSRRRMSLGPRTRLDQWEFFKVSLFLQDPQETVDLFWFWGEGAKETGASGVLLFSDDLVDISGDQHAASERYARLFSAFIEKRLHDFPVQPRAALLDHILH